MPKVGLGFNGVLSRPIAGCSAVLTVRRYYLPMGAWFVPLYHIAAYAEEAGSTQEKKENKKKQLSSRIGPLKNIFLVGNEELRIAER